MTTTTETLPSNHTLTLREEELKGQDSIETTLHYLKPPHDSNERLWYRRPPAVWPTGTQTVNFEAAPYPVSIHDARGKESSFCLDTHGFAFGGCPNTPKDQALLERIRSDHDAKGALTRGEDLKEYVKTMEKMLLEKTGASRVVIFDHLVRVRPKEFNSNDIGVLGSEKTRLDPVRGVHVDQSRKYGFGFLNRLLQDSPDDYKFVMSRAQIINVWRPLIDGVEDFPLTVLDWRSASFNDDVIPVKAIYLDPKYDREILRLTHNPRHEWHFLSKQKKNEAIFIKCFDSDTNVAAMSAHTAFANPKVTAGSPPRESIEVRAWVFYEGNDESEKLQFEVDPEWMREDLQFTSK